MQMQMTELLRKAEKDAAIGFQHSQENKKLKSL